jgi:hypothetical protein
VITSHKSIVSHFVLKFLIIFLLILLSTPILSLISHRLTLHVLSGLTCQPFKKQVHHLKHVTLTSVK